MHPDRIGDLDFVTSYLNTILDHVSQGILFIDLKGVVTTYNQAAEDALGVSAESVLHNPFWDHLPDHIFAFSLREALQSQTSPTTCFASWTLPNSRVHLLEVDTSFVIKERHKGMIILIRNITNIRRLQILANRAGRMKELGELAALIAHEIRNPLGGIKGFATLLQQELKDHAELHRMASHIVEGTDDLNNFVTKVLNYSRPLQATFELTNLVSLVDELRAHVMADNNMNSKIQFTLSSSSPTVTAPIDPPLFKSALLNLIVNAIQAMPDGGDLTILISHDKQHAIIEVRDNGEGIAEENMGKLFSPCFTTKITGNGFGLTEVDKVIKCHDGTIEVKSTFGEGTSFTIKIPLKI
jgi:PAS domain S-box-containing protein